MISYQKLVFLTFPNMLIICNVVVRRLKVCGMDVQNGFERQVKILFFDSFGVVVDLRRVVLETCADSGQRAFPISLRRIGSSMQWVTEISSAIFLQRCRNFLWVSLGQGENINNCKQPFVQNKGFYAVFCGISWYVLTIPPVGRRVPIRILKGEPSRVQTKRQVDTLRAAQPPSTRYGHQLNNIWIPSLLTIKVHLLFIKSA